MRAILREVAKCRELLGQILGELRALTSRLASIDGRFDSIDAKLAELAEGPDQSSVVIDLGPVSEQRQP
jgi:hypothetical protein